jgi:hypothetical protein
MSAMHGRLVAAISVSAGVLIATLASGAPPPGADPDSPIAGWFRSLSDRQGVGCCSVADCRRVDYRTRAGGFEVFVDRRTFGAAAPDAWVAVPSDAILTRENPTGEGVACFYAGRIRCFVQGNVI